MASVNADQTGKIGKKFVSDIETTDPFIQSYLKVYGDLLFQGGYLPCKSAFQKHLLSIIYSPVKFNIKLPYSFH